MRIIAAVAVAVLALSSTAFAKDMKSCSAEWKAAKATTAQKHKDFMAACMMGAVSPAQTATPQTAKPQALTTPPNMLPAAAMPTGATAQCKDGTYSKAAHHSGACSHHGGVAKFLS